VSQNPLYAPVLQFHERLAQNRVHEEDVIDTPRNEGVGEKLRASCHFHPMRAFFSQTSGHQAILPHARLESEATIPSPKPDDSMLRSQIAQALFKPSTTWALSTDWSGCSCCDLQRAALMNQAVNQVRDLEAWLAPDAP
jgi:hypothetical protein